MGWVILIVVVALLFIGFARGIRGESERNSAESDAQAENGDDQMLEDWYTSQELDNDLDDWITNWCFQFEKS